MENGKIADSQITASTQLHATCGACNARLNLVGHEDKAGAWSAGACNSDQWLQVDLGVITEVTGIMTQGRQDADECVLSYTISYSVDGTTFTSYQQNKVHVCGLNNTSMNSFVFSKLYYCSTVWSNTVTHNINKLQLVQNFATRVVLGLKEIDHISQAIKLLNWLPVNERIYLNDAVMMYKCIQ